MHGSMRRREATTNQSGQHRRAARDASRRPYIPRIVLATVHPGATHQALAARADFASTRAAVVASPVALLQPDEADL